MTIPSNITPIRSRSQQFAAPMISASLAGGEGVLGQVANDDHNVGGALLALQAARVAAENCAKVTNSIHGDQTLSAGAAHVKSDEVTQRIVMSTLPKLDRANEFVQTEITTLMAKTSGPVVDPAGRAFGSEIRAVLHKMDAKVRRQAIATAVEKNDLVTLGAILGAPALLTNLSANELEHLRQTWRRRGWGRKN